MSKKQLFRLGGMLYSAVAALGRLIYINQPDPQMPNVTFDEPSQISHHFSYPFAALDKNFDLVVSGDHIIGYNDFRSGSMDLSWFVKCFDFNALVDIVEKSLNGTSFHSPPNYSQPCIQSIVFQSMPEASVSFHSQVYGLSPESCEQFQNFYTAYAERCKEKWNAMPDSTLLFFVALYVLLSFYFITIVYSYLTQNTAQAPVRHTQTFAYPDTQITITEALKDYLQSLDHSEFRISQLSGSDQEHLEMDPKLNCAIGYKLMDKPVLLDGRRYDFENLLALPTRQGKRKDPFTGRMFYLNEIQADRETRTLIVDFIQECKKNHEPPRANRLEALSANNPS